MSYFRSKLRAATAEVVVTSVHSGGIGPSSRFLMAVWTLSPCLRGPLGEGFSSHRHVGEVLGLILLPLTEGPDSELELMPGRGALMAHSS